MKYCVEKLDEGTWLIAEGEGSTGVYMYLLEGDREAVLIDTGMGTIPLDEIIRTLTDKPISVILTHGHVDHIGSSGLFEIVYMNPKDRELYKLHGSPQMRSLFTKEKVNPLTPVERLIPIQEGQIFDLGGRTLRIIDTPGHTVGCVSILDVERRWLFTGDTCCRAHVLLQMDYNAGLEAYQKSIEKLLSLEGEYDITWPGHHGKPVGKDTIRDFYEATELLLTGKEAGREVELPMGKSRLFEYKGIGIEY